MSIVMNTQWCELALFQRKSEPSQALIGLGKMEDKSLWVEMEATDGTTTGRWGQYILACASDTN